ncbi:coiled-coil domain-containing protein 106-like [Notolabrus celidotus]|uniref:coiled-coil domain-containing protein 106-like n=2 Tax=Notolabrus celidotus TaxID=1203425 RepID=UPI00149049AD|nr:coiled-coil domain-containing protein 106-like [Notolabrus celidotus]
MKTALPKDELMTNSKERTSDELHKSGSEGNESQAPSCSSLGSGSVSKVEFLEEKILWQERMIKDLEEERDFLRAQIQGGEKKTTQQKAFTLEDDMSPNDMEDDHPPSSPNISMSSDSDVTSRQPKHSKRHRTRSLTPTSATRAHPGRSHRVKGPAEVIQRYDKVLNTFSRVRTMTEAFRINDVDRGTIKMTAPIAELKYVHPEKFASLKFDPTTETLLAFARKCARNITPEKRIIIEDMKSKGKLLPLLIKY